MALVGGAYTPDGNTATVLLPRGPSHASVSVWELMERADKRVLDSAEDGSDPETVSRVNSLLAHHSQYPDGYCIAVLDANPGRGIASYALCRPSSIQQGRRGHTKFSTSIRRAVTHGICVDMYGHGDNGLVSRCTVPDVTIMSLWPAPPETVLQLSDRRLFCFSAKGVGSPRSLPTFLTDPISEAVAQCLLMPAGSVMSAPPGSTGPHGSWSAFAAQFWAEHPDLDPSSAAHALPGVATADAELCHVGTWVHRRLLGRSCPPWAADVVGFYIRQSCRRHGAGSTSGGSVSSIPSMAASSLSDPARSGGSGTALSAGGSPPGAAAFKPALGALRLLPPLGADETPDSKKAVNCKKILTRLRWITLICRRLMVSRVLGAREFHERDPLSLVTLCQCGLHGQTRQTRKEVPARLGERRAQQRERRQAVGRGNRLLACGPEEEWRRPPQPPRLHVAELCLAANA